MPSTRVIALMALTAAAFALSGCGKKGPLEAPAGATFTEVKTPDGKTEKRQDKPKRPFVLDGLLN